MNLVSDVRGAQTWRGRLGYIFGPPGWSEHRVEAEREKTPAAA
nr:hypothetical protein [Nocardia tengchongensis]